MPATDRPPEELDRSRYPRVSLYERSLPEGLSSHPQCLSKGTLFRNAVQVTPFDPIGLPPTVAALIRQPPPPNVWLPAVLYDAVMLAVVDARMESDDAFLEWTYGRTLELARSPMYRILTKVASPSVFLRGAARAHGLLQKGSELKVVSTTSGAATAVVEHPPFLHGRLLSVANCPAFQAILEECGGRDVEVHMVEHDARGARYECTWR